MYLNVHLLTVGKFLFTCSDNCLLPTHSVVSMPICSIQTNLPSVPDGLHVAFSKIVAETLNKPEEVYNSMCIRM